MNLNEERKIYLIKQMALKEPLHTLKANYMRLFQESITGEELVSFEISHKDLIEKVARKELNDIKKEPLAHSRIRLKILYDAYTYAAIPKPIKSVPVRQEGKNIEYEVSYAPDYAAMGNLMKIAQNEEFFIKKLFLELVKNKLNDEDLGDNGGSGFSIFEVDNGLKRLESD